MNLPIGYFGAVMGITGLGIAARAAASVWPGVVRAPAYITEPIIALGVLTFAVLACLYLKKIVTSWKSVKEEFTNTATIGFCGTLPVGMFLVGGGLWPYWGLGGNIVWWGGIVLLFVFMLWALSRWLSGEVELAQVNAGWLVVWVGGIVAPGPGISIGHVEACRFVFGVSAVAALPLIALLLWRAATPPALPAALRPTWFILLVPPSLIYANGIALYPQAGFLEVLFYAALVLCVALLVASRRLLTWPVGPAWWAFTFPLDALAYAAARHTQDHPEALWRWVCAATLLLAAAFVLLVLWRTLRSAPWRAG